VRAPAQPLPRRSERLELANQERAEAAFRMENDEATAELTRRPSDLLRAQRSDQALDTADRKIRALQREA
jgi:hypothetical protein